MGGTMGRKILLTKLPRKNWSESWQRRDIGREIALKVKRSGSDLI